MSSKIIVFVGENDGQTDGWINHIMTDSGPGLKESYCLPPNEKSEGPDHRGLPRKPE
jgi:hypothetical protein